MHPDQLHVDTDTAAGLVAASFPDLASCDVAPLPGSGTVHAVFRVGRTATARFPLQAADPENAAAALHREQANLAAFARACPIPAPQPLGVGSPGHGYPMPWSLQTWLDGDVATPEGCSDSTALALDLATLIRAVRAADLDDRSFDGHGRGGHLPDHDDWVAECCDRSEDLLDADAVRALWARLREMPEAGPAVLSHRDLIPGNLLVDGCRLIGVLDAGDAGPADRALDLVCAWHLLDAPARGALRGELGCDDVEWRRGAAWALEQAMGLGWYYRESNPVMAHLGLTTMSRLLTTPELRT